MSQGSIPLGPGQIVLAGVSGAPEGRRAAVQGNRSTGVRGEIRALEGVRVLGGTEVPGETGVPREIEVPDGTEVLGGAEALGQVRAPGETGVRGVQEKAGVPEGREAGRGEATAPGVLIEDGSPRVRGGTGAAPAGSGTELPRRSRMR